MWVLFPAHPEHVRDAKVCDLESTLTIEQEVLGLDVTMGHTHGMQVGDTVHELLETTINLDTGHVALLDRVVQISSTAVFLWSPIEKKKDVKS